MMEGPWKMWGLVGAALSILAVFGWLITARANLKVELAGARARLMLCQQANKDWQENANRIQTALVQQKEETEKRARLVRQAIGQAQAKADQFRRKAKALEQTPRPQEMGCAAVQHLLDAYLKGAK